MVIAGKRRDITNDMGHQITHGSRRIEFEIVFRVRKNLSIIVEPQGQVRVIAPSRMKVSQVIEAMERNAAWVERQLNRVEESLANLNPRHFASGETLLYRGSLYPCLFELDDRLKDAEVKLGTGLFTLRSPVQEQSLLRRAMEKWYREEARRIIPERVRHYAAIIGCSPGELRIKNQQKRWGSCSQKGNLNFNWRLILVPDEILDYMVVHELCHMVHLNHSAEYWSLVGAILPDYQARRSWLKSQTGPLYAHLDYMDL